MDQTTWDFTALPYTILLTEEEQLRVWERSAEEPGCEPLCKHLGRAALRWLSCKHWLENERQAVLMLALGLPVCCQLWDHACPSHSHPWDIQTGADNAAASWLIVSAVLQLWIPFPAQPSINHFNMGGVFITNANMATSTSKIFLELLIRGAELMLVQLWTPARPLLPATPAAVNGKRNSSSKWVSHRGRGPGLLGWCNKFIFLALCKSQSR